MIILILEYTKNYLKEMLRNSSALFFTLFFPALLLSMFGHGQATDATEKLYTYIIYCNFAVQTVMLQALGITVAQEHASEWTTYLKTLPVSRLPSIAGRVISNLIFASISLALVITVNKYHHSITLPLSQHEIIIICALLGGIPMAFLALFLSRFLNPTAARGAFVLINTLLLFASFTFTNTQGLLATISTAIPTHQWLMFSISAINHSKTFADHAAWLSGYALLFYLLIPKRN